MSATIPGGELISALEKLSETPWQDILAVFIHHGANIHEDFVIGEDIAGALADLGIPFAGDIKIALIIIDVLLPILIKYGRGIDVNDPNYLAPDGPGNPQV